MAKFFMHENMNIVLRSHSFQASVIMLLTLLVYIPAMQAGFIWDDDMFLTRNPLIKAHDGLYRLWFTKEAPDYFPLVSTSLWLEWRLWGMNATGYHVVNIILHAINSVLILLVLRGLKVPGAWLAALIFAVHPVNVESVAWITERKNTQSMVFYLLAILSYLKFERNESKPWYFLSLGFFLFALLSKTSVVMLPVVLLGFAWWQRGIITRTDLIRSVPFFILSLVLGLVTVWFQYDIGVDIVRTDSFFVRFAGAGWAVWFYLYKALIPHELSFVYPQWDIDESLIVSYLPIILLLGCLLVFWRHRTSWGKPFLFGLGYYVATLFPVLGFLNIYFMKYSPVADHWQYISIIGLIALVVGVGRHLINQSGLILLKSALCGTLFFICLLSVMTWKQQHIYVDDGTLWNDTLAKNPDAWMAHNNLGIVLDKQGRTEEAIAHFSNAVRIKPDYADAHFNLGLSLAEQGRFQKAIHHYSEALFIKPGYVNVHFNLAIALAKLERVEEAMHHYSMAVRINPNHAKAHNNLGVLHAEEGRLKEAIHHFSEALRINPNYYDAQHNLTFCLRRERSSAGH